MEAGILTHKFKVEEFGNIENTEKDVLILFHGIYGTLKDLSYIKKKLQENGYSGVSIQYPTTKDEIQDMAKKYIEPEIEKKITQINKINKKRILENKKELKINFVVHSLGSVVLRHQLKENKFDELGKVVLISPPSHGSSLADNFISDMLGGIIGKAVKQIKTDENSFVNQLGNPDYECYVIIGNKTNNPVYSLLIKGKDDGMVPIQNAKFDNCKFKIIKGKTHTSILKSDETVKEILNFFE